MGKFQLSRLIRPNIADLKPYSSARDEFTSSDNRKIFLDANENPFDNGMNRYPDPKQTIVKNSLAQIKGINQETMLLGNGSDEVLDLLIRAFCEPGKDNVISLPPTYGMYEVIAGINNVENRRVLLTDKFQPDLQNILAQVDVHTKLLFLCSPNNPTANCMDREIVKRLLTEFSGLVVIDEAYIDFANEPSWLEELANHPNLVITQTFSKAIGMAGIRLGVCYGSREIIQILNRIKPPYNVNELTQRAALKRLKGWGSIREQIVKLTEQREILKEALSSVPFVERIFDSEANFLLVKVDNAEKRYKEFLNLGFVVRDRSNQPLLANCLRITIGTPEENNYLIKSIKK